MNYLLMFFLIILIVTSIALAMLVTPAAAFLVFAGSVSGFAVGLLCADK